MIVGVIGVLRLGPGGLVLDQPPFEGGHAVPAKERRIAPAPEEPQEIHARKALRGAGLGVIALSGHLFRMVQERAPAKILAAHHAEFHNLAVRGEGDAAVKQQIPVEYLV